MTGTVVVAESEVVAVDLEFGGRDDPMGIDIRIIDRIDFSGVGGVVKRKVEVDGTVAAQWRGVGERVDPGFSIGDVVPCVAVAFTDAGSGAFHIARHREVAHDDAVAVVVGAVVSGVVAAGVVF